VISALLNLLNMSEKKVVLVTGVTTRGLGASIACQLAQNEKYIVIGTLRDMAKATEFQQEIAEKGLAQDAITLVELDVTSDASVQKAVDFILQKEERIDILINNAGSGFLSTIESATMDEVQSVFNVNYFGVHRMIRAVVPGMREHRSGQIINVSSIGGIVGQPFNDAYCAAKGAVDLLTEVNLTYV